MVNCKALNICLVQCVQSSESLHSVIKAERLGKRVIFDRSTRCFCKLDYTPTTLLDCVRLNINDLDMANLTFFVQQSEKSSCAAVVVMIEPIRHATK